MVSAHLDLMPWGLRVSEPEDLTPYKTKTNRKQITLTVCCRGPSGMEEHIRDGKRELGR